MIVEPSTEYEDCVATSWESIGPYFDQLGLSWKYRDRLELFKQTDLYKVKERVDVGFFMVWVKKDKFFIADVHVRKEMRNKGYGRKILSKIARVAESEGYDHVWLRVFKNNPASRLYLRSGFKIEAEEENALLMCANANEIG